MPHAVAAPVPALLARTGASRGRAAMLTAASVVAASAVLAASAKVQIPFWPVPMTMQLGAVLLLSACMGTRLAAASVGLYLAEGLVGLPVFASSAGAAALLGPTAGYLAGFLAASALLGFAFERLGAGRGFLRAFAWMLAASALVYALGWGVLALHIGPGDALAAGVAPFVLGDLLKAALAALLAVAFFRAAPGASPEAPPGAPSETGAAPQAPPATRFPPSD